MAKIKKKIYEEELEKLHLELVKLQAWVKEQGKKVIVVFEGRDAAGKGGIIKRIIEPLNPRFYRIVALGVPTEKEKSQWYYQRYVQHFPSAGEIVIFDRSWYNRAGVERVMGFCSDDEYWYFMKSCAEFEKMLINSGIILIKYWLSVSDEEQEKRFKERIKNPLKQWKISPMDLESRTRWSKYARAKDVMFQYTDTETSPWYVINADNKKLARLNCIHHFLSLIPYEEVTQEKIELPPKHKDKDYIRPPIDSQRWIPEIYNRLTK
ncbi:polyphosphate kinase 2 [Wukongibacter baidiensis]|uniref:polyphosphate kinase 2 n=1 Tax=Wukongibacter baidiensis TaxID=1723361 RepID=UPI003D7FABFE